ncbi:hypothetical protein A0J61_08484 [Choanephora cucurbitarum]|uniref:Nitrogen regulatory protein areA GATA-like domain-containing protein n=1 Tax=Choanephora cucurbitarum TaxID=101091 RepID=A0A1C7N389_9FUNG|nr:hypothetical protein A0J61_08484 [Choanephora cucurbitarum]
MTAEHCVDYLSHQWTCDDLILTYRQMHQQNLSPMESEQNKTIRLRNALWRSMARCCISHLGKSNALIDPSTVYWQKESDITWLYGPIYTNHSAELDNRHGTSVLQGLKPVLKKHCNVAQILPNCSDPILSYFDSSVLYTHTPISQSSRSSSFSSFSSKSSVGVHFNPEIIEIEYQPEYPVASRLMEEEEDYDLVDFFWSLLIQAILSMKSRLMFCRPYSVIMMTKSVLATTWFLYQNLLPISWIIKKPFAGHKKHISHL